MKLWTDTEFEQLAEAVERQLVLANAWRMGVVEQTVADLLGYVPGEDAVPEVTRNVAAIMMRALVSGVDMAAVAQECAALIEQAKGSAH